MNDKIYRLIQNENAYIISEFSSEALDINNYESNLFFSINELFMYMFRENNHLSFLDIFKIFSLNNISFNKYEIIKYFISNSDEIKKEDEEIYIKIKINKGSIYEILSIYPKSLSMKKKIKGASLTIKTKKYLIPFYMAIFIKEYGIENYYTATKDIIGNSKNIGFLDLYNHNKEYYIVKNRKKIVYIATTKKIADYYIEIISSIRKDSSEYFIPNIEIISGFKNLINYLKIQNPDVNPNSMKNIVDFTKTYCISNEEDSEKYSLIEDYKTNYIIKTKEYDYILKQNIDDAYDFIIKNKIHSPELMEVSEMKRLISKREAFKSVFLSNIIENENEINRMNGMSILESDNLIKIYSNIVSILLKNQNSMPYIAIVLKNKFTTYDVLFFFDKESIDNYFQSKKDDIKILHIEEMSLKSVRNKLIEKNLEILMNEENEFSTLDIAINMTPLYKQNNTSSQKIKPTKKIECVIDVDSSLDGEVASCGIVLRNHSNKILGKISRELNAKTSVEAEIKGAMHAIKYAIMENFNEICLRYDYVGIFEYLINTPATDIAKEYQEFFYDIVNNNNIDIYLKKVKAHSLDEYNELADYLAGNLKINDLIKK